MIVPTNLFEGLPELAPEAQAQAKPAKAPAAKP
jgi:hypothetical protein